MRGLTGFVLPITLLIGPAAVDPSRATYPPPTLFLERTRLVLLLFLWFEVLKWHPDDILCRALVREVAIAPSCPDAASGLSAALSRLSWNQARRRFFLFAAWGHLERLHICLPAFDSSPSPGAFPPGWDSLGGEVLANSALDKSRIVSAAIRLASFGFTPQTLRAAPRYVLERRLGKDWASEYASFLLWSFASKPFSVPSGPDFVLPQNAVDLARLITGDGPADTPIGASLRSLEREYGFTASTLTDAGPRAASGLLASTPTDRGRRLSSLKATFNLLSSIRGSLRPVASGLRSWGAFCDSIAAPHFPVTAVLASLYGICHRAGSTYALYLGHVKKACVLLGHDTSWFREEQVRSVVNGVVKSSLRFKKPREALSAADLRRICTDSRPISQPRLLVVISWVFMLRVASEGVRISRVADDSAALDPYVAPQHAGALGLWRGSLCLRLRRRKNKPSGEFLHRGCSCRASDGSSKHCGVSLCPLCVLWPIIRRKITVGSPIFDEDVAVRARSWLQGALRSTGVPHASCFGLHAIRRGAARASIENGGSLDELCKAGSWSSRAFAVYLDLATVERRAAVHMARAP